MTTQMPDYKLAWPIPWPAVQLIANAEGCRLKVYRCPAGVPTIGWGHTGADVTIGMAPWTQERADQALLDDIVACVQEVRAACAAQPPSDNQLGALVSFAFNCLGWQRSTVIKRHNEGDWLAASRALNLWTKARVNGVLTELPGLTARRAAEQALYLQAEQDAPAPVMPQAVEAESPMLASPINRGGIAAAGTGIVGALSSAGDSIASLKAPIEAAKGFVVGTLGVPAQWVPWLVLIGVGLAVIWWRQEQRRQGWA